MVKRIFKDQETVLSRQIKTSSSKVRPPLWQKSDENSEEETKKHVVEPRSLIDHFPPTAEKIEENITDRD